MGCLLSKQNPAKKQSNILYFGQNLIKDAYLNQDENELKVRNQQFVKISAIRVVFSQNQIESFQLAYEITSGSIVPGLTHCKINKRKNEQMDRKKLSNFKIKDDCSELNNLNKIKQDYAKKQNQSQQIQENNCNQLQEGVFEIIGDDYLQELSCNIGDSIEELAFKTYRGNSISFGQRIKGKGFKIRLQNETFGPFASNSDLNSLRIEVFPLPKNLINSISQSIVECR